ncbi:MAG: tetratricopeptide repeat protein [Bryobacteraceae bacterium]
MKLVLLTFAIAALAQQPEEALWRAGTTAREAGEFAKCKDAFARLVATQPKLSPAVASLGLCEFELNEYPAALEHLQKAVDLGLPKDAAVTGPALERVAELATKAGLFDRAMTLFRLSFALNGESPDAIALAGLIVLRRPMFPGDVDPDDRGLVFRMGRAALTVASGQTDAARTMLEGLASDYPTTAGVHYAWCTLLLAGDPDACASQLKQELAVTPAHVPSLVALAVIASKNEAWDEALSYLERALKADPSDSAARYQLASVHLAQGKAEQAATELEALAKDAPQSAEVRATLASAYYKLKRKADGDRERAAAQRLQQEKKAQP